MPGTVPATDAAGIADHHDLSAIQFDARRARRD
jgi:hypothetical protein